MCSSTQLESVELGAVEESAHTCGITSRRVLARNGDGVWLGQCRICFEWFTPPVFEPYSPRLTPYVATRPTPLANG